MRVELYYVILPKPALVVLAERFEQPHPALQGALWKSSEHHGNREHSRTEIERASWTAFIGDFDTSHATAGERMREFLVECLRLKFEGCFDVLELGWMEPADDLIAQARDVAHVAQANLALIGG